MFEVRYNICKLTGYNRLNSKLIAFIHREEGRFIANLLDRKVSIYHIIATNPIFTCVYYTLLLLFAVFSNETN